MQCKFATTREVDLRRIHSNASGYVVKRIEADAYDWLYVLRPDGAQYVIKECHAGRRSVTPQRERLVGQSVTVVASN